MAGPSERARLKIACADALDRAEEIKRLEKWPPALKQLKIPKSTRILSKREQIIVLKGSKLNGSKFPPWRQDPDLKDFELSQGDELFL